MNWKYILIGAAIGAAVGHFASKRQPVDAIGVLIMGAGGWLLYKAYKGGSGPLTTALGVLGANTTPATTPSVQPFVGGAGDLKQMATTTVSSANGGRTIFGLIAFATVFSLLGNEIKTVDDSSTNVGAVTGFVTEGGRIIIGGTLATAFLLLISHAGQAGEEFAVGLSLVTAVTSMLVFGGPVWSLIGKTLGETPPTAKSVDTVPTSPQKVGTT